jgi:hypothetical protein
MMAAYEDLRGRKFGRLVAVAYAATDAYGHAKFLCQCSCDGAERVISARSLKHQKSRSCACLRREQNALRKKVK